VVVASVVELDDSADEVHCDSPSDLDIKSGAVLKKLSPVTFFGSGWKQEKHQNHYDPENDHLRCHNFVFDLEAMQVAVNSVMLIDRGQQNDKERAYIPDSNH
jgi:hypothetical protein